MSNLSYVYFEDENNHKCHTVGKEAFKIRTADDNQLPLTILKGVFLPPSIRTIDDEAFHYCFNLENISLNDNITTIGKHAFSGYLSTGSDTFQSIVNMAL
jgi:hypothetical protein